MRLLYLIFELESSDGEVAICQNPLQHRLYIPQASAVCAQRRVLVIAVRLREGPTGSLDLRHRRRLRLSFVIVSCVAGKSLEPLAV